MAKDLAVQLSLVSDKFQKGLQDAGRSLKSVESSALSLNKALSMMKGAASGYLGWKGAELAVDLMKIGAAAKQAEQAFAAMASRSGQSGEAIIKAMKKATNGIIDDSDLMQKAIKGMTLGLTGEDMAKIGEMARQTARVTGESVGATFEKLADAISTNMPKSLKQMGLITKEQMAVVEKALAAGVENVNLLAIASANFADQQRRLGPIHENESERLQKLAAQWNELRESIGKALLSAAMVAVPAGNVVITYLQEMYANLERNIAAYGRLYKAARGIFVREERPESDYAVAPSVPERTEADMYSRYIVSGADKEIRNLKDQIALIEKRKKDEAAATKDREAFIREVEKLELEAQKTIEQGDANQWKNMEKLLDVRKTEEEKAAADRMKLYEKIGEDEEKAWKTSTKVYKQELDYQQEFAKQAARNMQDAFADFFFSALSGELRSFSDYWDSFWNSMKRTMSNYLAEMALTWAKENVFSGTNVSSILGQFMPGLLSIGSTVLSYASDAASIFTDVLGLVMHEGGLVGDRGVGRTAGLAPDEVAAILQKGEYVIPKDVMDAMRGHGPGGLNAPAGFGVQGPANAGMTKGQAVSLVLMALSLPTSLFAVPVWAYNFYTLAKAIDAQNTMTFQEAINQLGTAAPTPIGLSLQEAMDQLGAGSYGGAGTSGNYGGGPDPSGANYDTGGIVPYTQIAKVHGGEGIFTPAQMQHLRTSGSTDELLYWLRAVVDRPIKVVVEVDGREIANAVGRAVDQGDLSFARS